MRTPRKACGFHSTTQTSYRCFPQQLAARPSVKFEGPQGAGISLTLRWRDCEQAAPHPIHRCRLRRHCGNAARRRSRGSPTSEPAQAVTYVPALQAVALAFRKPRSAVPRRRLSDALKLVPAGSSGIRPAPSAREFRVFRQPACPLWPAQPVRQAGLGADAAAHPKAAEGL